MFSIIEAIINIMGSTESKDETKTVDSTGEVNNNLVIQESTTNKGGFQIVIPLYIICGIKILELFIFIYKFQQKKMKKKYMLATRSTQEL